MSSEVPEGPSTYSLQMFEERTWLLSTLLKDRVSLRQLLQFRLAPFGKVSPVESVGHACGQSEQDILGSHSSAIP